MTSSENATSSPEHVLICFTAAATAQRSIREAARMAMLRKAELYALYVEAPGETTRRPEVVSAQLERNVRLARDLGAQVKFVHSHRVADSILQFARTCEAKVIVMGESQRTGWWRRFRADVVTQVRRGSGAIEIVVVA